MFCLGHVESEMTLSPACENVKQRITNKIWELKKFWIADASLGGRGLWKRLKAVDVNKIPKREPKGHNQLLLNDLSVYVFKSLCLLDKYTEMFTRKVV